MKIQFTRSSEKELSKLDKKLAQRIFNKIKLLAENPSQVKTEKLTGVEGFRFRVGDYRVIYIVENEVVVIVRIRHRREVYKF